MMEAGQFQGPIKSDKPDLPKSIAEINKEKNLRIGEAILQPLSHMFNPEIQYMVLKSPEFHGKDGLLRFEITFKKESLTVKDSYLHGSKIYFLDFATMKVTLNGRPASDEESSVIKKRLDQSKMDFKSGKVRFLTYPRPVEPAA